MPRTQQSTSPGVLDPIELPVPRLPSARDGFRMLHITDLHVRRSAPWPRVLDRLEAELRAAPPADVLAFTGDAAHGRGDTEAAIAALARLIDVARPMLGAFGVMGNHDGLAFRNRRHEITGLHWIAGDRVAIDTGRAPIVVVGSDFPEDVIADIPTSQEPAFTIGLIHDPSEVYAAAALGIDLVLAGHTHGGQIRFGPSNAPHTACDLSPDVASGLLTVGATRCAISRGLGETALRLRYRCPPHAPIYTLRAAGEGDRSLEHTVARQTMAW